MSHTKESYYMEQRWKIIDATLEERIKQDAKWGEQNHPIIDNTYTSKSMYLRYNLPSEEEAKNMCNTYALNKELTWGDIIVEELVEALCAPNKKLMREELIQCAAVIVAMIESLDRNGK
jgi:hypothetical protein